MPKIKQCDYFIEVITFNLTTSFSYVRLRLQVYPMQYRTVSYSYINRRQSV